MKLGEGYEVFPEVSQWVEYCLSEDPFIFQFKKPINCSTLGRKLEQLQLRTLMWKGHPTLSGWSNCYPTGS